MPDENNGAKKLSGVPWTQKYKPKKLGQVVENKGAIQKILKWLKAWDRSTLDKRRIRKKAVLLFGPPGTGKTVVVEAIANEYGYTLFETNASDFRTAKQIDKWISRSTGYQTLDQALYRMSGRMILFDEIDGISGRGDRGGVKSIIKFIKKTTCPVFLTANDVYQPKLRALRQYCLQIGFTKPREEIIASYLNEICKKEGIKANIEALFLIAKNSNGDLRAAINDLQALCEGKKTLTTKDVVVYARNKQLQSFEALRTFFSAKTIIDAKRSIEEAALNYEIMMLCIDESIPYQFKNPYDLVAVYDLLSKANMLLRYAKTKRKWKLMSYFFDLIAGIPLYKKTGWPSNDVRFSQRLIQMSRTRAKRNLIREIGFLLGKKCHVSSSVAIREIAPYIRVIFSSNPEAAAKLSGWLELKEEMIKYLSHENANRILELIAS